MGTLSWHLDVFDPAVPGRPEDLETNQSVHLAAKEIITRRIKAYAQAENGYQGILRIFNDDIVQDRIVSDSTYNLLRFVRCFRIVEIDLRQDSDFVSARNRAFNRFRNKLHEQLSLWEVWAYRSSRFLLATSSERDKRGWKTARSTSSRSLPVVASR